MTGKLDQSLDQILSDRKGGAGNPRRPGVGRRRAARVAKAKVTATVAPVGGVQKKSRNAPAASKAATAAAASASAKASVPAVGDGKIIVSNLPEDVTETQIKEYFAKSIGPVKKVLLTYGPNGRSRGISTILFSKPQAAVDAAKQLNGVKVDNRPMKVEVVYGANNIPASVPAKSLSDRVSEPKKAAAQPRPAKAAGPKPVKGVKPATSSTTNAAGRRGGRAAGGRGGRGGNPNRRPKKTAEQLDAEMQDYFGGGDNAAAAAPAGGNDTAMATEGAAAPAAAAVQGGEGMDEIM